MQIIKLVNYGKNKTYIYSAIVLINGIYFWTNYVHFKDKKDIKKHDFTKESILKELIGPIRERRIELAKDPDYIMDILKTGTDKCRDITQATLDEVKSGLGVFHF